MFKSPEVIHGDSLAELKNLGEGSVHLILSDIPYGISYDSWDVLHDNKNSALLGSSPAQKNSALFKCRGKPINGWSEADREIPKQYYEWCLTWAPEWLRVLKPGGSVIIFAGRRYCHRCVCAMEDSGFNFKDMLAWMKPQAPHRAQRLSKVFERRGDTEAEKEWEGWKLGNLRPTFEPILWFTKPYQIGKTLADNALEHGVGAYNEVGFLKYEGKPDNVLTGNFQAGERGHHPTQKPIALLKSLIELTTKEGQMVLDPYCGSGSTLVASSLLNRNSIGIDSAREYVEIARQRVIEK